ncbi:cation transport protein ChaC [Paraburkholderia sp. GAS199]|uniref:gamma-glutamylcyclotransferase n=1 Tax=Paraburkholderia sp. GAS199 TaxID=3035126 RepID=UPI003D1B5A43
MNASDDTHRTSVPPSPTRTAAEIPALSRDMLAAGLINSLSARDAPALRLLSDEERNASLTAFLAERPEGDVWVFAYGSLIWNPVLHSVERRVAWALDWHRAFCLTVYAGRGSAATPGLSLALDAGGECSGIAYRLDENSLHTELDLLWRREMLSGAYVPKWLKIYGSDRSFIGHAIGFTVDRQCSRYAGHLSESDVARQLALAKGYLGTGADYLNRTVKALRSHHIPDLELERIAGMVLDLISKGL